jgi:glycosyltransferase involved in cell wall biosynthesis
MTATAEPAPAHKRLVTLVLPVFDEEGNLRELHTRITDVMRGLSVDYELLFVDDGSTDGSMDVLEELQREDPKVRVIQFRRNFGKAAAYSAGFDDARGEFVITMDTDLQDDPLDIPLFLEELEKGVDVVCGWKHEGKGDLEKSMPSRFFNRVVRRATGIVLHDFNCPFKAYRAEVLKEIRIYGELHRYIPVLAHSRGFSLSEVKVRNHPRGYGRSKYGWQRYTRGMLDLFTVIFITRFARRPMHLLGLGGLISCAVGGGVLAVFIFGHLLYVMGVVKNASWDIHDRPAISLGILLIVVGMQFLTLGLLSELLIARVGVRADELHYSVKKTLGGDG